ncbi:DUF3106 domain-containing protein [Ideonella sp.]|uniref:DUF3106 domain-containing protein n=1 Tax=Ideonella sp. TaxID=1929293 RepID=UPI0035B197E3
MTDPAETTLTSKTGRRPWYLVCLLLAASAAISVLLLRVAMTEMPTHALTQAPPRAEAPPDIDGGPSWAAMSATRKEVLRPLKTIWPTMSEAQHRKWQLIADRIHGKSPQARQRLHDRMVAWARMTPSERAAARLAFLRAKSHAGKPRPEPPSPDGHAAPEHLAKGLENQPSLPPAMVHVAPGATTVLLTHTFHVIEPDDNTVTNAVPKATENHPPDATEEPMPS